ncbi:roadblock/LC7 domain-containing protein [Streptomyces sp. NPDC059852]|uniref:roadblock/LC7 domain-containing protein n=1 Tax=Streptomyces sp. NPDC059852 TaxID=3346972 RepID=UPI0036656A88
MTTDLSWMLEDIVTNVPKARHAVLLSADGISRGATQGLVDDDLRTISAAMAGMQALSRAAARFIEPVQDPQWHQTIIEFSHGWIFLIGAGQGAYLAAAAELDVDIQQISFRMHRLVARLGNNLTTPPRVDAEEPSLHGAGSSNGAEEGGRSGTVLADLDEVISGVHGARHAVLLGAEGLPLGATSGIDRDLVDTISAAMMGIHAYSRVTSQFAGAQAGAEWRQTVIEFQHGWIFLIAGDHGRLLAAAAEHDTDIEEFTTRLGEVVPRLTEERVPRQEAPSDV